MQIPIPPGVFDILPIDPKELWRSSYLWQYLEEKIREIAHQYGFREIRTPVFERTELFLRGVGETTDIVTKEMYTFEDKGQRSMTLRPEGTAPAMRAFIEHQLSQEASIHKLYYLEAMFRYERSQSGRYRQHHQFGVEAIGNGAPEQDAEVIDLIYTLYHRLGLKNLVVNLNSIGDPATRTAYREALVAYFKQHYDKLSRDSQNRLQANPLRILDSKEAQDIAINAHAPSILEFLNDECKDHFEGVKKLLDGLQIPYRINPQLVRGLDYYNKTVFEIVAMELGAQNSLVGGGRYDGLLKTLGGPDLPSIGFGTGLERILQTLIRQEVFLPQQHRPAIFLIALGQEAMHYGFKLLKELRQAGISAEMDFSGKKLNKAMQYADYIKARTVGVIGENELQSGIVSLKEMETGTKRDVALTDLMNQLKDVNEYV
ncbi:MAG: histidine--tRNA ligase [Parachlamydia sp.]|nr:histidine--tRNA ligase [Parachlamydia sp.]